MIEQRDIAAEPANLVWFQVLHLGKIFMGQTHPLPSRDEPKWPKVFHTNRGLYTRDDV